MAGTLGAAVGDAGADGAAMGTGGMKGAATGGVGALGLIIAWGSENTPSAFSGVGGLLGGRPTGGNRCGACGGTSDGSAPSSNTGNSLN